MAYAKQIELQSAASRYVPEVLPVFLLSIVAMGCEQSDRLEEKKGKCRGLMGKRHDVYWLLLVMHISVT